MTHFLVFQCHTMTIIDFLYQQTNHINTVLCEFISRLTRQTKYIIIFMETNSMQALLKLTNLIANLLIQNVINCTIYADKNTIFVETIILRFSFIACIIKVNIALLANVTSSAK